jgi:hypothetical protein
MLSMLGSSSRIFYKNSYVKTNSKNLIRSTVGRNFKEIVLCKIVLVDTVLRLLHYHDQNS